MTMTTDDRLILREQHVMYHIVILSTKDNFFHSTGVQPSSQDTEVDQAGFQVETIHP